MTTLHLDFESRSPLPFGRGGKTVNVYVYADCPDTDLWCAAYAFDDDDVQLWLPGEPCPKDITRHVNEGKTVAAHNAQFERIMTWRLAATRYGWPTPQIEQWGCTMARCYAMALPGALGNAAKVLQLDVDKDDEGGRLMMQMAKPRKRHADGTFTWWDAPEKRARLYEYCMQDVVVERQLDKALFQLSDTEKKVYWLDQRMNDRGVYIDGATRYTAQLTVGDLIEDADREMGDATQGAVNACSQIGKLTDWSRRRLTESGLDGDELVKSLDEESIDDLLALDIPEDVETALTLRKSAAKTSTSKLDAMERHADKDGRVRGTMQYCGAGRTGRWSGRGPQFQNLPRPSKEMEDPANVEMAITLLKKCDSRALGACYDEPLSTVAFCLRSVIKAEDGKDLIDADFSNIEGRGNAWMAGETWKLDAFRAFDRGDGPDLYLVAAGKIFGKSPEDAKPERQIGKVSELALGYGGGPNAFATMAKTYGLRIADHYENIWSITSERIKDEVFEAWEKYGHRMNMAEKAWRAAEAIKRPWREAHPAIVQFWEDCEEAAKAAVRNPGGTYIVGDKLKFKQLGSFLMIQLPSGRILFYAFPTLRMKTTPWGATKETLFYQGVILGGRWGKIHTYGGKLVENIVQAVARDLMAEAGLRVDPVYPLILSIHDELLSEVEKTFGSVDEFCELMSVRPAWARDFPLAVDGWRRERFGKWK